MSATKKNTSQPDVAIRTIFELLLSALPILDNSQVQKHCRDWQGKQLYSGSLNDVKAATLHYLNHLSSQPGFKYFIVDSNRNWDGVLTFAFFGDVATPLHLWRGDDVFFASALESFEKCATSLVPVSISSLSSVSSSDLQTFLKFETRCPLCDSELEEIRTRNMFVSGTIHCDSCKQQVSYIYSPDKNKLILQMQTIPPATAEPEKREYAPLSNKDLSGDRVIREKQTEAARRVDLSVSLNEKGKYSEAERELKEAIKLNPFNATAHGNLGAIFLKQGKPKEAILWLEKALNLNPKLEGVTEALAQARTEIKLKTIESTPKPAKTVSPAKKPPKKAPKDKPSSHPSPPSQSRADIWPKIVVGCLGLTIICMCCVGISTGIFWLGSENVPGIAALLASDTPSPTITKTPASTGTPSPTVTSTPTSSLFNTPGAAITLTFASGTPESGDNIVHQTPSHPTASPGEVISGPVEALSNIRMVAELDPDGIAQSIFPHDSPIAIAFDFDGSLVDETDEYTLTVVDSAGAPIAQIPLYGPDNLIYGGTQFIIGAGYIRHFAVPILSEDEKLNPGEYRSDIALNGKTIASISWSIES